MDKNTANYNKKDSLLESLVLYTKLYHKPYSAESLMAGLPASHLYSDNILFTKENSKSLFSKYPPRFS